MTMPMTAELPVADQPRVTLRRAGHEDCERVWTYNFAPDVRAMSQRSEIVALVEHARWYARRLADPVAPIWIVQEWGEPVGVVRLDLRRDTAVISIALAKSGRGRGVGRAAIAAVCAAWGRPIIAEILADNHPSRVCFEACGFREIGENNGHVTYRWSPE